RSPHPLDRRFHRSGLGRPRHARVVERRQPAGDDLSGDEDRADLVRAVDRTRAGTVRKQRARLQVPGTAWADTLAVLAELPAGNGVMILVTGGSGFVGGHVVHALRAAGKDVRALVRDRRKGRRIEAWGATLVEGDMTDPGSLRRALEGCDTVVHLVAIRQGREEQFRRVMVEGTRDLLAAARDAGIRRFVHTSALGTKETKNGSGPCIRAMWQGERRPR